ncbi:hypothetical protein RvY_15980 [Ramazzottius varieornatus]|uniref:Uncharacterized protein n=1 Tax=Ramazzottius varieornatus TaxID=947166 RepID=A0A1D1W3I1_RAMVA|nr:hypothetical protein RvY_15980 [Ramazzottius varieornatus]
MYPTGAWLPPTPRTSSEDCYTTEHQGGTQEENRTFGVRSDIPEHNMTITSTANEHVCKATASDERTGVVRLEVGTLNGSEMSFESFTEVQRGYWDGSVRIFSFRYN